MTTKEARSPVASTSIAHADPDKDCDEGGQHEHIYIGGELDRRLTAAPDWPGDPFEGFPVDDDLDLPTREQRLRSCITSLTLIDPAGDDPTVAEAIRCLRLAVEASAA
jgi:hypothetical protein